MKKIIFVLFIALIAITLNCQTYNLTLVRSCKYDYMAKDYKLLDNYNETSESLVISKTFIELVKNDGSVSKYKITTREIGWHDTSYVCNVGSLKFKFTISDDKNWRGNNQLMCDGIVRFYYGYSEGNYMYLKHYLTP